MNSSIRASSLAAAWPAIGKRANWKYKTFNFTSDGNTTFISPVSRPMLFEWTSCGMKSRLPQLMAQDRQEGHASIVSRQSHRREHNYNTKHSKRERQPLPRRRRR